MRTIVLFRELVVWSAKCAKVTVRNHDARKMRRQPSESLRRRAEPSSLAQEDPALYAPCQAAYPIREGIGAMKFQLTPDQIAFVRRAMESGRLHSEEQAVQEALGLWEERERGRVAFLTTLDEARASLARGEGRAVTQESMRQLSAEV